MDEQEPAQPGVLATLRRLGSTLLAIFWNRLDLLTVELQEERIRLFNALLLASAVFGLGFFTLVTAAAALLIATWDKFGVLGLFVLSGLGLIGTVVAYWRLRVRLNNWSFLPDTLAELKKDSECLKPDS